jgi:hypothetical protein
MMKIMISLFIFSCFLTKDINFIIKEDLVGYEITPYFKGSISKMKVYQREEDYIYDRKMKKIHIFKDT